MHEGSGRVNASSCFWTPTVRRNGNSGHQYVYTRACCCNRDSMTLGPGKSHLRACWQICFLLPLVCFTNGGRHGFGNIHMRHCKPLPSPRFGLNFKIYGISQLEESQRLSPASANLRMLHCHSVGGTYTSSISCRLEAIQIPTHPAVIRKSGILDMMSATVGCQSVLSVYRHWPL